MRNTIRIFFLVSVLFSSCVKEILVPDLEGSVVGFVYTFDEFANRLEDRSNVQVIARGLKIYITFTDRNGRFEFEDLPTGTYDLGFYKPGFGALYYPGVKHLGGMPTTLGLSFSSATNCSAFFLYQIPKTEIIDLKVENDSIHAKFRFFDPEPDYMRLSIYLSDKNGFTSDEAKGTMLATLRREEDGYKGFFNYNYVNFPKGTEVFYIACILNRAVSTKDFGNRIFVPIDSYFDYTLNKTVYPNLGNESAQFSFIVP